MSKKHPCAWLAQGDNRLRLPDYLAILRRGVLSELSTLPQDFLDQWKSANSGAGAFHYAANHADHPCVVASYLAGRGLDPNATSLKGVPVLAHSLNRGKGDTLAWCSALEAVGARVDLMPCKGTSVLLAGVQANLPELVWFAAQRGARRVYPDKPEFQHREVPDQVKIIHSRPDRALLAGAQALEDALPATQEDLDRQWLVSLRLGYFEWAEHFLSCGAQPGARDPYANTALHVLAERLGAHRRPATAHNVEWVHRVARLGVALDAVNAYGRTALDVLVSEWDHEYIVPMFLRAFHDGVAQCLDQATRPCPSMSRRSRI